MIAADTSTWVAFLGGDASEDVKRLDRALEDRQVVMVPLRSQSLPQEMCSTAGFHADQLHLQIPSEGEQLCS